MTDKEKILAFLAADNKGHTRDEIAGGAMVNVNTTNGRIADLEKEGQVEIRGHRVVKGQKYSLVFALPAVVRNLAKKQIEFHDLTALFPPMDEASFTELKKDIAKNGQQQPIYTYLGKIIDGRNRYMACMELGIMPKIEEWVKGDESKLLAFVISQNLHRRHLTTSQRAVVGEDITNLKRGVNKKKDGPIGLSSNDVTIDDASKLMKVSPREIRRVRALKKTAAPAVVQAVRDGHITVHRGLEIAKKPREEQPKEIGKPKMSMKNLADGQVWSHEKTFWDSQVLKPLGNACVALSKWKENYGEFRESGRQSAALKKVAELADLLK